MRIKRTLLIMVVAQEVAGCGSPSKPASMAGPTSPPPTITAISPAVGSTGGTTEVTITGTGLDRSATASFGSDTVGPAFYDPRRIGSVLMVYTRAHVAGTVDVVLTNPDGQSARLRNAYTFVPQQTFDFNGEWSGWPNNGQDVPIRFEIRNSEVLSASCLSAPLFPDATLTFSPPLPVTNSEFSFVGDGVTFTGRMVAATEATGTIKLGVCESSAWDATKP